ncbi:MAG TPA: DinB family protein [Trebonia sp.]
MSEQAFKADLCRYLKSARESVVWKLDGLAEYELRRPLVRTGTNLLGLVKHLTAVEYGYFGETFGRPSPDQPDYDFDADPNADFIAETHESREGIIGAYQKAWRHADATISELPLDAVGHVPWWPQERAEVTLHHIIVRVVEETGHHAGHADIIRELIDGAIGLHPDRPNLAFEECDAHRAFYDRAERTARDAAGMQPGQP